MIEIEVTYSKWPFFNLGGEYHILFNIIGKYFILSSHAYITTSEWVKASQTNHKQFIVLQPNLPTSTDEKNQIETGPYLVWALEH